MRIALASRTYGGRIEVAAAVALEERLGVYWEHGIQAASLAVPGFGSLLGFLYLSMHLVGTTAFLVWVYRSRRTSFAFVRTTIVLSTAIALVGYIAFPAAPPRLADLGFSDAVSAHTGLNLSSDLLGALYNPIAAVPSLHFGYALIVGAGVYALARNPWVRAVGVAYPLVMLYVIVATGNHFLFDAAAGGAVVVVAWLLARWVVRRDPTIATRRRAAVPTISR
jgi:PAP2 superfamily